MKIFNWLFTKGNNYRVSSSVYWLLWIVGLIGILVTTFEFRNAKVGSAQLGSFSAFALAVATIALQWAIYNDLHFIEEEPERAARDYPKWLNMPLEIILRSFIVFWLLFGVGEIAGTLYPIVERIQFPTIRNFLTELLRPSDMNTNFSHNFFVKGSLFVFGFMACWNFFALRFRKKHPPSTPSIEERAHQKVVTIRICIFLALSILGVIYWSLVLENFAWLSDSVKYIFVIYMVAVLLVILPRFEFMSKWLEQKMKGWLEN